MKNFFLPLKVVIRSLVLSGFLAGNCPMPLLGQAVAPDKSSLLEERRFLFIVDTSFSMASKARSTEAAIRSLLLSGMSGQMRAGDTFGIWTFNEELQTGNFPVQRWLPELNTNVATRTTTYLKSLRYEKKSELKAAVTNMLELAENLGDLTVLLITDGQDAIEGTPFDSAVNTIYKKNARALARAKIPFVTVFVSRGGEIVDYSVNTVVDPINLPPFERATNQAMLAALKRPSSAVVYQATNAPAETNPRTATPPPAQPKTIPPAVTSALEKIAVPIVQTTQPPVTPIIPAPVVPKTIIEPVAANPTPVVRAEPKPPPPIASPTSPSSAEIANPVPTVQKNPTTPVLTYATSATNAADTRVEIKNDKATVKLETNLPPATNVATLPANRPPVATNSLIKTNESVVLVKTIPRESNAAIATGEESGSTGILTTSTNRPQIGLVVPDPRLGSKRFLGLAIALFAIAAILLALFLRRSRTVPRHSLISRSIDKR